MLIFINRIIRLIFGLFLYALGVVLTIQADIGYSAWDIFHHGVVIHTGIGMGTANIVVSFVIIACAFFLGEEVGFGTLLNMLLIGTFMNVLLKSEVIPLMGTQFTGFIMMAAGLIIIAFASYFYIGAGFGAGPRDSIMVMLVKKMNCRVGAARAIVEGSAAAVGWLLGGFVGTGTIISAFGISIAVHVVFSLVKFNVKEVKQESLAYTLKSIREIFAGAGK